MSVAHWGETGEGKWTVIIKDTLMNEHSGTFTDWRIKLFGEALDAKVQKLLPMPGRHDDDDHDVVETEPGSVSTTSVDVPVNTGKPPGNPDDHIHRPVNSKISPTPVTPTSSFVPSASAPPPVMPTTVEPTSSLVPSASAPPQAPAEDEIIPDPSSTPAATDVPDANFLPRPFPTFGVSKRTQIWIYGAISLILLFLVALGAWTLWVRRKRRRRWDDYAFEMVGHDDDGAGNGGARRANGYANGGLGGRGGKKRAGELYDAFAEGSDDGEMFDLGSDDEDEGDLHAHGGHEKEMMSGRYRDDDPRREGLDVE